MQVEHHLLSADFPEYKETIHTLKLNNAHFAKLFAEYEDADKAVTRGENGSEHVPEVRLEELKKVRISLKDQLFHILQAATKN